MTALRIAGLTKTYRPDRTTSVEALKALNLSIEQGEIFGLLGPNGAGKTTLVKILLGIIAPSAGEADILGHRVPSVQSRALLGYLPENHRFPQYLSARQFLEFCGGLTGMQGSDLAKRIPELLERVSLEDWQDTRIRKFSKGMLQRLGIAQALLNQPRLLILDEPTDGIDPIGRKDIRDLLLQARSEGTTIFLNSHLLSEVELITDRVAIMNKGQVVLSGKTSELTESPDVYEIETPQAGTLAPDSVPGLLQTDAETNLLEVRAESLEELNAAVDVLRSRNVLIQSIRAKRNTLENLFIDLIENV